MKDDKGKKETQVSRRRPKNNEEKQKAHRDAAEGQNCILWGILLE